MLLGLIVVALVFLIDQGSKYAVDVLVSSPIEVTSFFKIVKVWNTGVSFSMFNDYGNVGRYVLIIFALVVIAFLLHWMWHEENMVKRIGLAMIIGGALGNVADRAYVGAVMDFLYFYYKDFYWPAFNAADTFICVGAFLLVYMEILYRKKKGLKNA